MYVCVCMCVKISDEISRANVISISFVCNIFVQGVDGTDGLDGYDGIPGGHGARGQKGKMVSILFSLSQISALYVEIACVFFFRGLQVHLEKMGSMERKDG